MTGLMEFLAIGPSIEIAKNQKVNAQVITNDKAKNKSIKREVFIDVKKYVKNRPIYKI